jgi:hypothetical protein
VRTGLPISLVIFAACSREISKTPATGTLECGASSYELNGTCVACAFESDCGTDGTCDKTSHTCVDPCAKCNDTKPGCVTRLSVKSCVESSSDVHCKGNSKGPICDLSNNTCGGVDCGSCVGTSKPKCVQVNGSMACVECAQSSDCLDSNFGVRSLVVPAGGWWGQGRTGKGRPREALQRSWPARGSGHGNGLCGTSSFGRNHWIS